MRMIQNHDLQLHDTSEKFLKPNNGEKQDWKQYDILNPTSLENYRAFVGKVKNKQTNARDMSEWKISCLKRFLENNHGDYNRMNQTIYLRRGKL
jgi:hypothetical protein